MGLLEKFREGLKKTRDALFAPLASIIQPGRGLLDEDFEALEAALLRADVGPDATDRILEGVRKRLADGSVAEDPRGALRGEIETVLRIPAGRAGGTPPRARPHVTLVIGVNGTGKTTSIAKLAHRYREEGESVLLVAADTFRAAASDQLEIWAKRAGADVVSGAPHADPASVAFDGVTRARLRAYDRVLVDTAGRLHVKSNLMEELKKIRRVIERGIPGAPHETLLVLDATTGQNGLAQAREFHAALDVTGLVLTKLDGTAKGGVVLAIAQALALPIRWVGLGEGMEDLVPFDPAEFATALTAAG
ncbi:MAG TPA: signal recognition particle-docking protein FtsY [Candidatus Eisenbacteria bacterium]